MDNGIIESIHDLLIIFSIKENYTLKNIYSKAHYKQLENIIV